MQLYNRIHFQYTIKKDITVIAANGEPLIDE